MTVAQNWALIALIGVFATAVVTMVGLLIAGVRSELRTEIGSLRSEMNARFEHVDARFDHLDRDLQAVIDRVFRRDEG